MRLKCVFLYLFFVLILCFIGFWIFYCQKKYSFHSKEYDNDLNSTFHQAVLEEALKRIYTTQTPFYKSDFRPNSKKLEHIRMTTASGTIYLKRTEEYERLSIEEKDNLFIQTFMCWQKTFINLTDLNDIWQQKLQEKRIIGLETGIKFRYRDFVDTLYSDRDSIFFINSSRINWYTTGIFDEIDLQGHYIFSTASLFNYAKKDFIIYIGIGFILIIILAFCSYFIFILTSLNIKVLIHPVEEKEYLQILKAECYSLNDNITLYVDRALLVSNDGREACLTPKMVKIFEQFIASPVFYANNKVLWKNVWGAEEDPSNVLTQMIKNIRNEIEIFPEMGIRNIHKRGYQLFFYLPGTGKIEPPYPTAEEMGEEVEKDNKEKIA